MVLYICFLFLCSIMFVLGWFCFLFRLKTFLIIRSLESVLTSCFLSTGLFVLEFESDSLVREVYWLNYCNFYRDSLTGVL